MFETHKPIQSPLDYRHGSVEKVDEIRKTFYTRFLTTVSGANCRLCTFLHVLIIVAVNAELQIGLSRFFVQPPKLSGCNTSFVLVCKIEVPILLGLFCERDLSVWLLLSWEFFVSGFIIFIRISNIDRKSVLNQCNNRLKC